MDHTELGELRNVNVREVWEHEASNFTPWLSQNLSRLSAKLGVNLELEGTEVQVGRTTNASPRLKSTLITEKTGTIWQTGLTITDAPTKGYYAMNFTQRGSYIS